MLQRGKNQEKRLQDELRNIQGNAALVEELLAWLTDAQVLLSTKERDPIPDDLKVVEDLYKEHLVGRDLMVIIVYNIYRYVQKKSNKIR